MDHQEIYYELDRINRKLLSFINLSSFPLSSLTEFEKESLEKISSDIEKLKDEMEK